MKSESALIEEFQRIEDQFNAAMVSNDVEQIAQCITDDWALVNPQSGPLDGEIILNIIGNGTLSHSTMSKQVNRVKLYGDVAVVTGRGQNTGTFQGSPIQADEWITDVYVRTDAGWRCAITHLTPAAGGN